MKKLIALLLALVMVLGMFAACAPASEGESSGESTQNTPPSDPEVESEVPLVIQWDQSTTTDKIEAPYRDNSLSYHTIFLWDKLYLTDESKEEDDPDFFVWQLATSLEHDETGLITTITLRDDAVWDDGEPITGEDLAFTVMAQILDPMSKSAATWKYVVGYEALTSGEATELEGMKVEGNTVTFESTQANLNWNPNPNLLPAHCFEGVELSEASDAPYWKNPVGSGPYKMAGTKFPDSFSMTRSETYYGKPAGIKNVTCVSYKSAGSDAAVAAVIAGEADITTRTVTSEGGIATNICKQNPDCVSRVMPSNSVRAFAFNMGTRTDGKDKTVLVENASARQAISLLIDDKTIAEFSQSTQCIVFGNPDSPLTNHDLDATHEALNVEKAKQLLDAAGWNYDDEIDILEYYGNTAVFDIMTIIKTDAAKAGVKINHITIDSTNAGQALYTDRNYDLMFYQGAGSDVNPADGLSSLKNPSWTFMYPCSWIHEKYESLCSAMDNAPHGSAERIAAIAAAQKANYEDCLIIPVYINNTIIVYNQARIYVPDTAFDFYDNVLDLDQWRMLVTE